MLTVRRARASDASSLSVLNEEFNKVRMKPTAIARRLSNMGEIVLVAQYKSETVGFACGQVYDSICYPGPQAELTELYVRKEFRRLEAATRLCRMIESEAGRRKAVEIHLLTNVRNAKARGLYEKLGYKAERHVDYGKRIKRK